MLVLLWLRQCSFTQSRDKATVVESPATLSLVLWVRYLHDHPSFNIMDDITIHNVCIYLLYWFYKNNVYRLVL